MPTRCFSKFGDPQPLYRQEDIHSRLGKTKTCKFWPYLGDWQHPYAVYDFTTSRERDGPRKFLAGFTYTLNQWDPLCRYTDEGFLAFDNNLAERLVKIPAIGRKNFLFVGSPRGDQGAAVMYSLVSSAKANAVEPFAWLKDLFTTLPYHRDGEAFRQAASGAAVTSDELDYLLPEN